uniref:Uncharacterized protein n=1 Tax=uncultured prokaryote TaxID=198431 RepID=A0A0H5Q489_9ZZZZ|nr:hypothetical protein [uncultured prokaryote]
MLLESNTQRSGVAVVAIRHSTPLVLHADRMTTNQHPNKRTASTTPEWRWAKIRATPARPSRTVAAGALPALKPWDTRYSLSVTVKYRGGAEAWWEITARGRVWRRPGHLALDDVLREVANGTGGKPIERS